MDSLLKQYQRLEKIEKEHNIRKRALLGKNSKAEKHFAQLLDNADIYYIRERCCFSSRGDWCYIDFYIPFYNIAIEIDGKEHSLKWRAEMDKRKTAFLKYDRHITTIRYTNEECLSMSAISIREITKKAGINIENKKFLKNLRKARKGELEQEEERAPFDIYSDVYLFDKDKDKLYHFDDLFHARKSMDTTYIRLYDAFNKRFDEKSKMSIILSKDKDEINTLIDNYYIYVQESKRVKNKEGITWEID